ncbi:NADPH-dependent FMN reductase [Corynebacterium sputi]|uniref:NADPH-dependent FMN reductase n=1 Tax=Corynebacterium sputi TaxID=489915 RepID=UPI0004122F7B|nr:NAD(P)H-dependent oxidoreductase [Corynebacterium sputi]
MKHYIVLIGSLRHNSTNRQLAEAFIDTLPEDASAEIFEQLRDVPFYDEDLDVPGKEPRAASDLRSAVKKSDGVVIVTPEHNHTAPAVITNAIDWCSRPMSTGVLSGKPVLVLGTTPGPRAISGAIEVLRESLDTVGAAQVPTDYTWGDAYTIFDGLHPKDVDEVVGVLYKAQSELARQVSNPYSRLRVG